MHKEGRTALFDLFRSGVLAVKGEDAVKAFVEEKNLKTPTKILAAGKAAVSMFEGLPPSWRMFVPTLLITKTDHIGSSVLGKNVEAIEASHPIPDKTSLVAGGKAFDFVRGCTATDNLLMLISGGASSLVEHLIDGTDHSHLTALTLEALAGGANIADINARRRQISRIKGGKLLAGFNGARVDVLAISDVYGDDIGIIGSGLGARPSKAKFEYSCGIVASNSIARAAIVRDAEARGLDIIANSESMYADVSEVATGIARDIDTGPCGLYVYGGEPTVVLPDRPGLGGRNQALALELAKCFQHRPGISGLVAGTDGTDGPTQAAGAFLDDETFKEELGAEEALQKANSARYLSKIGDQIITGPTGTNVMDLAILIKHA